MKVINDISEIKNLSNVIELIEKQMKYIGGNPDVNGIKKSLENALSTNKRAVLFLSISNQEEYQSFTFANVASGLESGGDYLWINELFVDEKFRGLNQATNMLKFIEKWCSDNEIKYIACCTGEINMNAQSLYIKNGYDIEKTMWVDKSVE